MTDGVVVSWVTYHGRSAALASELGYECEFVYTSKKVPSPIRYWIQAVRTWKLLRGHDYGQVIVMLPPLPALLCVLLTGQPRRSVIGDLHTGFFLDPKWRWLCGISLRMLKGSRAIVTNAALAEICRGRGVNALVLHDILRTPDENVIGGDQEADLSENPTILCPLSYANDEPISEIIEAAKLVPHLLFVFTGNAPTWVKRSAPENVQFAGYISNADYWTYLRHSWGVLALTERDFTMQRAGYEALLVGKPHVTSDFQTLRDFYGEAAIYTRPSGEEIAKALQEMIGKASELSQAAMRLLAIRAIEQQEAIRDLATQNGGRHEG